ncbi:MAG: hypothetical protein ACRDHY_00500, partial [Anaerolineales bacterium]
MRAITFRFVVAGLVVSGVGALQGADGPAVARAAEAKPARQPPWAALAVLGASASSRRTSSTPRSR